jgi:hypothetical protein
MDAHELKPVSSRRTRPWPVRLAFAWLAAVLVWGLWQSYGAWLLGSGLGLDD